MTAFVAFSGGKPVFERPAGAHKQVRLPCGGCIGCRIDKSRDWQVRMVHELHCHDVAQFVTLTYRDECLPLDNGLDHSHWQKFIRSLRKRTKLKLRFFVAGEYGKRTSRPHYHAMIYGLPLDDLVFHRMSKGHKVFRSPFLERVWDRGQVFVGETVTSESCGYVASYLLKDGNRNPREDYFFENPQTGERVFRKAPYVQMSRKPGLGHDWLRRFVGDVFPRDRVIRQVRRKGGGQEKVEAGTPVYYRRLLRRWNPELWERVQVARESAAVDPAFAAERAAERLAAKERCALARLRNVETSW